MKVKMRLDLGVDWPPTAAEEAALPEPREPSPIEPTPVAPVDVLDVAAEPETAEGGLDPDRPWTDDLKLQVWDMREKGLSVAEVARRVGMRRVRVHSFLKNVKSGCVKLPRRPPSPVSTAVTPAAAEKTVLPKSDPAPAASEGELDPQRPWTDSLKLQVWDMTEDGFTVAQIGKALSLNNQRLHNFLWMIRNGKARLPARPATARPAEASTAVAVVQKATHAVAMIDADRREVVRDPGIVADWQERLETAEREKAVTNAYFA